MTFGEATLVLRSGAKACREGWNGKGMWIALQIPDKFSKMQRPYFYIKTAQNQLVPWCPSHGDLLGDDWKIASGEEQ
jgi:hypothetical protein